MKPFDAEEEGFSAESISELAHVAAQGSDYVFMMNHMHLIKKAIEDDDDEADAAFLAFIEASRAHLRRKQDKLSRLPEVS